MTNNVELYEGQTLPVIWKTVTQEQINRYAHVSGDFNPLHLDAKFAQNGPFGRIVAHGMLTLAFVSEMLFGMFERNWAENGRLKTKFSAPVYPGEQVVTFGSVAAVERYGEGIKVRCDVGCRKPDGQNVVTGEAWLTIPLE